MPVTFTVPTAVNGKLPVTVTCSRPSGSAFSLGSTAVTCTATDALARQASCNFNVTVTVTPKISKTKFLAFGDSITFGRCGPAPAVCPPYTVRLEELLRARYTEQNFLVVTRGFPGDTTSMGEDRLPNELSAYNPEVLLLMEGTNDLTAATSASKTIGSLDQMIFDARARGVTAIFLATVPPIAPGGPNNSVIPSVAPLNAQIRDLAARRSVQLVDVYAALNADVPRYYVDNDLHPTAEGLRVIGETFYAAIRAALDITPGGGSFSPASEPAGLFTSPGQRSPVLTARPSGPANPRSIKKFPGR